jgi:2-polyprenyl-6-methoxyphenol hydroxylase-like FAD-dependent oxidoreductase
MDLPWYRRRRADTVSDKQARGAKMLATVSDIHVFDSLVNAEPPAQQRFVFGTACVLGGSIAGLLAARVLSDFARHVMIIERDELGDRAPRRGVPQGHQLHELSAAGGWWLERWLPGFTDEALSKGAIKFSTASASQTFDNCPMAPTRRQYEILSATRPLLESVIRSKVLDRANVSVKCGPATGLRYRDGAVSGVEFTDGAGAGVLNVDFVVDATGRSSRTFRWVADAGFDTPRLERLALPIHYATAMFERSRASLDLGLASALSIFSPGNAVDGVSIACVGTVENEQSVVCLIGCGDDRPGETLDELRAKCAELQPIFRAVAGGKVTRDVITYHQMESRRRHFTDLDDFPARLVCVGDAVASFNPVYGQGMSAAALHASCLAAYLSQAGDFDSVAREFFGLQRVVVDAAWDVSTAGDRARLDFLNGVESTPGMRYARWAQDQITKATLVDSRIAELYSDVQFMLRHPSALDDPEVLRSAVAINLQAS